MDTLDSLDDAYENATPASDLSLPPGWYRIKVFSAELSQSSNAKPFLKLEFVILDGDHTGEIINRYFWLSPAAIPFSKRDLASLGFGDSRPSEIAARANFDDLAFIWGRVGSRTYGGRTFSELQAFSKEDPTQQKGAAQKA
ncbi:MAG: DUF669 domain-containing protein [Planctomycetes bacterium]|nr:DUF669 domain-containing protein [Planctomycetota bacterium]